jgi:hypothetical protein
MSCTSSVTVEHYHSEVQEYERHPRARSTASQGFDKQRECRRASVAGNQVIVCSNPIAIQEQAERVTVYNLATRLRPAIYRFLSGILIGGCTLTP